MNTQKEAANVQSFFLRLMTK